MGPGVAWWLATVTNVCCGQAPSGVIGPGWVTTRVHDANPCTHMTRVRIIHTVTLLTQPISRVSESHK